jgi:AcrR family transcriptional regulator/nitroreductase
MGYPAGERVDKRHTDTKERLFKIALKLFADKGFESTSIRDIVGKAGISTAAFYNHFKSKDSLLRAVYKHYLEGAAAAQDEGLSSLADLIDACGPVETIVRITERFRVSMDDPVLSRLTRIVYMERRRDRETPKRDAARGARRTGRRLMMLVKEIDRKACSKCGECARICANSHVIETGDDGYPRFVREPSCIHCGHCLAICPTGAVSFRYDGPDPSGGYVATCRNLHRLPGDPEAAIALLEGARSCRGFGPRAVERNKLERVLEAMVRAPSAGNEQNRCYYALGSKEKVDALEADTAGFYRTLNRKMASPLMVSLLASSMARVDQRKTWTRNRSLADMPPARRKEEYRRMLLEMAERSSSGKMSYFNGAPAAFLVTSRMNAPAFHREFYKADVEIAVTYGVLAASALGLASCRMGLSEIAFGRDGALRAKYGIPPTERVDGILALGYSDLEWKRLPPRGPVQVKWL